MHTLTHSLTHTHSHIWAVEWCHVPSQWWFSICQQQRQKHMFSDLASKCAEFRVRYQRQMVHLNLYWNATRAMRGLARCAWRHLNTLANYCVWSLSLRNLSASPSQRLQPGRRVFLHNREMKSEPQWWRQHQLYLSQLNERGRNIRAALLSVLLWATNVFLLIALVLLVCRKETLLGFQCSTSSYMILGNLLLPVSKPCLWVHAWLTFLAQESILPGAHKFKGLFEGWGVGVDVVLRLGSKLMGQRGNNLAGMVSVRF